MADETPKPTWAGILRVYRWTLFASPRSSAAKLCTFFIVVAAIRAAFELLLPGGGVEYLSWDHLYDVGDPVADGLMWFLALMFVRERDMARVTVAALQGRVR